MSEIERIPLEQYKDFPYCVVGHTSIPDSFSICLTAQGLKEIVKKLKDDDCLSIEFFTGYRATEFKIVRSKK